MKVKILRANILIFCFFLVFLGCRDSSLYLTKSEMKIKPENEIDTIDVDASRSLCLVQLITHRAFGKFTIKYFLIKKGSDNKNVFFEMKSTTDETLRITEKEIAFVKSDVHSNWGWFSVKAGVIEEDLPNIKKIVDSIEAITSDDIFIRETNGYISFYKNSKIIKQINYGEIVLNDSEKKVAFDQLDYKLYRIEKDTLRLVSQNSNDLFKEKDGIYFIPPPGYGQVRRFEKSKVYSIVDSVSKLKIIPVTIKIGNVSK